MGPDQIWVYTVCQRLQKDFSRRQKQIFFAVVRALTICTQGPTKRVLLQTVKTQMKCSIMLHLIRVCTVCKTKGKKDFMGAQWLSGIVLDWRPRGREFGRHCVVSLSKTH